MEESIPKITKVTPKFIAQVCPNCNGRATVGYDRHPCPTCARTNTPGIVMIPAEEVRK